MIELITARGNTSLESALSLTKEIRWQIQELGIRVARAASNEEQSGSNASNVKKQAERDAEVRMIIADMRSLLERIEDAVPLMNLAITTSGVSLTTNLPASISPSRLLQASTFLSAGDAQYSMGTSQPCQIGPAFTLSLYMLFSGYTQQHADQDKPRNPVWKEVIHKARVKLVRVPLDKLHQFPTVNGGQPDFGEHKAQLQESVAEQMRASARIDEFAYQLSIIEDLDDGRVHTVEDGEAQPQSLDDVDKAGIRETLPIHQVSKIFYADTGKILNIGSDGETNNPVLLLRREITAVPPRRMMERDYQDEPWYESSYTEETSAGTAQNHADDSHDGDDETGLNAQFARESTIPAGASPIPPKASSSWALPRDLDPEWLAFEVFTEEVESDEESESGANDPNSASQLESTDRSRQMSLGPSLAAAMSRLQLHSSPSLQSSPRGRQSTPLPNTTALLHTPAAPMNLASLGEIRTSLSLLEMMIRLTSLQQFQQSSHLAITDELLNFFLEESSTTGAAPGDIEARKRIRLEARQRVGFDPYDESPIKRRGELYQNRHEYDSSGHHETSWDYEEDVRASVEEPLTSPRPPSARPPPNRASLANSYRTPQKGPLMSPRATPPMPGERQTKSAASSPLRAGSTKSREAFLRDEAASTTRRSSPLARDFSLGVSDADLPKTSSTSPE